MLTVHSSLPESLRMAASLAEETAQENPAERPRFYDQLFGLHADWRLPAGFLLRDRTDPILPAEFIPIANFGVDGAQAGLVVHAPELDLPDYPVGCFCGIDQIAGAGVVFAGRDTRHFLELRLSATLAFWAASGENADELRQKGYGAGDAAAFAKELRAKARAAKKAYLPYLNRLAKSLGISPSAETTCQSWGAEEGPLPAPKVPEGWRYLPAWDHVGVLAKAELFDPSFTEHSPASDALNAARHMRSQGYPATALYLLKQHVLESAVLGGDTFRVFLGEMAGVYEDLGRPLLAQSTRETLARL